MTRHLALPLLAATMTLLAAGCAASGHAGVAASPAATASPASGVASTQATAAAPAGQSPGPGPSSAARCGAAAEAPAGNSDELTGVQFASASTGWVVGLDRILGTGDGGVHWQTQYRAPASASLASVDFVTAARGWVVGGSTIITTADGGRSWRPLPEPCPLVRSVHFISPAVGFAVAGGSTPLVGGQPPAHAGTIPLTGGVLLKTSDGGLRWRQLAAPADAQTVCFASQDRGWLGADGQIYGTVNGGRTWALDARRADDEIRLPSLAAVQCAGSGAAWAELIGPGAAMSQEPHVGYHTGGPKWTPIFAEQYFPHPGAPVSANSPGSDAGPVSAVSPAEAVFIDSCEACGTGTAPMDLAEHGGAVLLPRGNVRGITEANAAAFITIDDGWVVGTQTSYHPSGTASTVVNRIVHTADGGRSWQILYTLPP